MRSARWNSSAPCCACRSAPLSIAAATAYMLHSTRRCPLPADTLPLPSEPAPSLAAVPLGERLTWTLTELSALTGVSVRQLRRLDADRHIPGRLTCGRKVLFASEV